MMGLSRNVLWTSYFIQFLSIFLVTVSLVTVVLMAPFIPDRPVIKHSDWSIVWARVLKLCFFGIYQ